MPARAHFYRPRPLQAAPEPASATPDPAPTKAESAKPRITPEQAAEFRAAIDAARGALREDIDKLYAKPEPEPTEPDRDAATIETADVSSPESRAALAGALRRVLANPSTIET